jgi:hypothetical protein
VSMSKKQSEVIRKNLEAAKEISSKRYKEYQSARKTHEDAQAAVKSLQAQLYNALKIEEGFRPYLFGIKAESQVTGKGPGRDYSYEYIKDQIKWLKEVPLGSKEFIKVNTSYAYIIELGPDLLEYKEVIYLNEGVSINAAKLRKILMTQG